MCSTSQPVRSAPAAWCRAGAFRLGTSTHSAPPARQLQRSYPSQPQTPDERDRWTAEAIQISPHRPRSGASAVAARERVLGSAEKCGPSGSGLVCGLAASSRPPTDGEHATYLYTGRTLNREPRHARRLLPPPGGIGSRGFAPAWSNVKLRGYRRASSFCVAFDAVNWDRPFLRFLIEDEPIEMPCQVRRAEPSRCSPLPHLLSLGSRSGMMLRLSCRRGVGRPGGAVDLVGCVY